MTHQELCNARLHSQLLSNGSKCSTPQELVNYMGAMQAQDYTMSKWAVGCRLKNSTEHEIEVAFNENKILRTHVLRPTWHFVSPQDIKWMLKLTGPRLKSFAKNEHKKLGIGNVVLKKSKNVLQKAMTGNQYLIRSEIKALLDGEKIATSDNRLGLHLFDAEVEGLICSAGRRGKQLQYGLLDEIVLEAKLLDRDEALQELANRYFISHGPATVYDFSWWSGLTVSEAKKAVDSNASLFEAITIDDSRYWYRKGLLDEVNHSENVTILLPAFDELLISYKDRSGMVADANRKEVYTNNGIFRPVIVLNNQIIGTWKSIKAKGQVTIEKACFNSTNKDANPALKAAMKDYARFIGMGKKGTLSSSYI